MALLAFATTTYAQKPDARFGLKTGLNVSSLTNDVYAGTRTGFHLGAVTEVFISNKFSIQPELMYSAQGSTAGLNSVVLKLNYLNIPVMAKYYITNGFSIQAGPQFGLNVKSEMEINNNGRKTIADLQNIIQTVDFGLNFGLGYQLQAGVFFDARYNFGLTNVNKNGSINGTDVKFSSNSKNEVFQLSVGYKF